MPAKFDFSWFERTGVALGLAEKEIPFALAQAMTRAAATTKDALVRDTWPRFVQVKSNGFLKASLAIESAMARDFREGGTMSAGIYDELGHVDLSRLALGGTKRATKTGALAIPTKNVKRNSNGAVLKGQKPRALPRTVRKGNLIFQAQGRGKNSKLKLMYAVRSSASIKPQVPFYSDFDRLYRAELYNAFPQAVRNVMKRNNLRMG